MPSKYLEMKETPNAPEEALPFDELEGIDVEDGLKRVGGNKKMYLGLLKRFLDSQCDSHNQIKTALETGDIELAERLAHTTKGVSGNIGAMQLQKASESLERAIRENDQEAIPGELNAFSEQLNSIDRVLKEALSLSASEETSEETTQHVPTEQLQPMLIKLHDLLADDDTEAEDYLEEIAGSLHGSVSNSEFDRLKNKISQFALDEALEDLEQIASNLNISLEG